MVEQIDNYKALNTQPLASFLDTEDLQENLVPLRWFAIGALDRCRQSAFIC